MYSTLVQTLFPESRSVHISVTVNQAKIPATLGGPLIHNCHTTKSVG